MPKLTVVQSVPSTLLKTKPLQASALPGENKVLMPTGKSLNIAEGNIFDNGDGHYKIVFEPPLTIAYKGVPRKWEQGFIYGSHWQGLTVAIKSKEAASSKFSAAGSPITLQHTPLFIQNDNKDWGDDSSQSSLRYGGVQCGLTSAAMLIATLWPNAKVKALASEVGGQFEDWVAGQFKRLGAQSTSMEGHVAVLASLGIKATATRQASIADLSQSLHTHPVILGLAYKASGHFVCGMGVADRPGELPGEWMVGEIEHFIPNPHKADRPGIIINDPYGCRDYSGSGNNWVNVAHSKFDTFGLHNVLSTSDLSRFWVDGGEESGWAVMVDPSTPNVGNGADKPIEIQTAKPKEPIGEIKILFDTWLKTKPESGTALKTEDKTLLVKGSALSCSVVGAKSGHAILEMPDGSTKFIFNSHFEGQEQKSGSVASMAVRSPVELGTLKKAISKLANPNVPIAEIDLFCETLLANAGKFTITKRDHMIHFLAQCLHESGGLQYLEELASGSDYDDRDDLGNLDPKAKAEATKNKTTTGRLYKGRGLIQCTGWTNYLGFEKRSGIPATKKPHLLAEYPAALISALDFWATRGPTLSDDVDKGGLTESTVVAITKVVNGGTNGLDDRLHYFHELCRLI